MCRMNWKLLKIFHYQNVFQYCFSFTDLSFNNLLFIFYFLISLFLFFYGTQRRLGCTFLKNLSKMPFKKGQKSLLFCLKLFEYPLMTFNNFKPLFCKFLFSGLFKYCSFMLARGFLWWYFSLSSFWKFIYLYIYIYINFLTKGGLGF